MASANIITANQRISDIQNEPCKMLLPIEGYEDFPLLPLDISVEPLENIIPNIARNSWIAKERTDEKPSNGLTRDESASIHLYTMEWKPTNQSLHLNLNVALRAQNRDVLVPYFGYLKLILSALWKLQSVKKTVWRGIKADLSSQYPVGKTFVWWGFSSCTESLTLLESEKFLGNTGTRTLFNIECESGKEIHQHSYFQEENEILLLPATQFQVLGKINPASGFYIIHLKETKPPFTLLQPPFSQSTTSTKSAIKHTSHEYNNETSVKADLSETESTKTPQYTITKLTKPYRNQKLETIIQQKAMLEFAEFREKQLSDEDAHLIADEIVRNTSWQCLSLSENNIHDYGITRLASVLNFNKTLKVLHLRNNHISDTGAKQLSNMLKVNTSLTDINLSDNNIGDSGMTAFATALKLNTTLKQLDLIRNKITDQSVCTITDIILQTKTLYFLKLENNQFSPDAKAKLYKVAKQSQTCVYLESNVSSGLVGL